MTDPIPQGYTSLTAHLVTDDMRGCIDYYIKAFNAEEMYTMHMPNGDLGHAEVKIGNAMLMIGPEWEGMSTSPRKLGGTSVHIALYVEDCDAAYKQALEAGGTELMAPMDAPWGDRYAQLTDPFGHVWEIMTHTEDLTPEEIAERMKKAFTEGNK